MTESIDASAQAVAEVRGHMKLLSEDEISDAAESALKLQGVFEDADIARSTSAANEIMKAFNVTQEEAFALIAKGYQEGLNDQGDMLDAWGEYARQVEQAGGTLENFYAISKTGLAGSGMGDCVKVL